MQPIVVKKAENPAELEQCYMLRFQVLRQPWQQPRGSETDGMEAECFTALALTPKAEAAGTGRLQKNTPSQGQIRYMAVATKFQGQGVGAAILGALEQEARRQGLTSIVLNARENALKFYLNHGYQITGDAETLWGIIPHKRMEKFL